MTDKILDRLGLTEFADTPADSLPTGTGRLVEVGRALAARPRYLLLDEPAAGLDAEETEQFAVLLRSLADDEGIAIVLVEHDMSLVMSVVRPGVRARPRQDHRRPARPRSPPRRAGPCRVSGRCGVTVVTGISTVLELQAASAPPTTRSPSCTAWTSLSPPGRLSPCSAPTARARRPRSRSPPASHPVAVGPAAARRPRPDRGQDPRPGPRRGLPDPRGPRRVPQPVHPRQPADDDLHRPRRGKRSRRSRTRGSPSSARTPPARRAPCPAASSRCSPSPGAWPPTRPCCCSTSYRWASRRSWSDEAV